MTPGQQGGWRGEELGQRSTAGNSEALCRGTATDSRGHLCWRLRHLSQALCVSLNNKQLTSNASERSSVLEWHDKQMNTFEMHFQNSSSPLEELQEGLLSDLSL